MEEVVVVNERFVCCCVIILVLIMIVVSFFSLSFFISSNWCNFINYSNEDFVSNLIQLKFKLFV